jgi:putative ABC transport system substrate-binding protein
VIGRREFISLLGGATAAWPIAARAQQAAPLIGSISAYSQAEWSARMMPFRAGLSELGFLEGKTINFDYRWADGQIDRLPALAADLSGRHVALIFTTGSVVATRAAMAATQTIPIVFTAGANPVSAGLVASLDRPGGNVTGVTLITTALTPKRLELLREMLPGASKIALLVNPHNPVITADDTRTVVAAAHQLGLECLVLNAGSDNEIERTFAAAAEQRVSAVVMGSDGLFISRRRQIASLGLRRGIPVTASERGGVEAGALMSYGPDQAYGYRQAGLYAGRILKGEKPADLPVMQPTKFELVVNLATAKAIGVSISESFLLRADEVIE